MKVSIVEDDVLLRQNLNLLLSGETGISVVSVYSTAEEALAGIKRARPEILLADIGLPGMSGIELIRELKEQMPDLEIMAHTVFDDRETVFSAIKAGASGYILKGSTPRELIDALHTLAKGGSPMSPKIARKVIREFQGEGIDEQYLLSHRETEIVKEIENGLSYKDIAVKLGISPHTVHTHIKNIYEKLHAKNRQGALIAARKKGII
ncbi:MAG: response regulator transcription factor [Nitrospirae bacterium]|nr:response regulator transcription factor [Nitrospirota bacterium]NTW66127.1 response regulator transcription factor [Nitrospirota bacterium]